MKVRTKNFQTTPVMFEEHRLVIHRQFADQRIIFNSIREIQEFRELLDKVELFFKDQDSGGDKTNETMRNSG